MKNCKIKVSLEWTTIVFTDNSILPGEVTHDFYYRFQFLTLWVDIMRLTGWPNMLSVHQWLFHAYESILYPVFESWTNLFLLSKLSNNSSCVREFPYISLSYLRLFSGNATSNWCQKFRDPPHSMRDIAGVMLFVPEWNSLEINRSEKRRLISTLDYVPWFMHLPFRY